MQEAAISFDKGKMYCSAANPQMQESLFVLYRSRHIMILLVFCVKIKIMMQKIIIPTNHVSYRHNHDMILFFGSSHAALISNKNWLESDSPSLCLSANDFAELIAHVSCCIVLHFVNISICEGFIALWCMKHDWVAVEGTFSFVLACRNIHDCQQL